MGHHTGFERPKAGKTDNRREAGKMRETDIRGSQDMAQHFSQKQPRKPDPIQNYRMRQRSHVPSQATAPLTTSIPPSRSQSLTAATTS